MKHPADPPQSPLAAGQEQDWLIQYFTTQKSDWEDDVVPAALSTGSKYEIRQELGEGGMKCVRRVLDVRSGREVAMAKVKQDGSARRFLREARITAALEHPNIVPIHEMGVDAEGAPYFTMKLLGGETLHAILAKLAGGDREYAERYALPRLLGILLSVCDAVAFAHSRGVLHLDLKPENIQVGSFGEVLVMDWGLARVLERDGLPAVPLPPELAEATVEGLVLGTPDFMAPEQARGDTSAFDERTDVYALGRILNAMLDAAPGARVSRGLQAVLAKACAPERGRRYDSAEAMARDIRAYVGGFPTAAQEASLLVQLGLLIKRHRAIFFLVGAALILIVLITSFALVRIHHSERAALAALEDIKVEKERRRQLGIMAAPRVLQQAAEAIHRLEYEQAMPILDYTLSLDDSLGTAWQQKAAIHLGRLEFAEALAALREDANRIAKKNGSPPGMRKTVAEVVSEFENVPRDASGNFPPADAMRFARAIADSERTGWSFRLLALSCFFQRQNARPEGVDYALIEAMLRRLNPGVREIGFFHESSGAGLKVAIRGANVTQILPLTGLPITSLDLSDTAVTDLAPVRDAPLVELDLSGTSIGEFQILGRAGSLQTLRLVDWKRKDFDRVRLLPQLKRLVIGESDERAARRVLGGLEQPPELVVDPVNRARGSGR